MNLKDNNLNETQISFSEIVLIIAKNTKLIFLICSISIVISIFYVQFIAQPMYTSTSKIISSSGANLASRAAGLAAQFGLNLQTGDSQPKWVYQDIIKSSIIAEKIIKRKFDTEAYGKEKELWKIITGNKINVDSPPDTIKRIAIRDFIEMISISEDIRTGVFTLKIESIEAGLSFGINKALIEELDDHQQDYNKSQSNKTKLFVQDRIQSTEKELIKAEEDLKTFRDRNRRIENSPTLQLEEQRLMREVSVLTGVFTTLKQQLETVKIEELKESDYVIVIDQPQVPLYRSKPSKKLIVIITMFVSIFFGLIISLWKEYYEKAGSKQKQILFKAGELFKNNLFELLKLKI